MTLVTTRDFRITPRALMFDPEFMIFDFVPESGLSRFLVVEEKNLELAPFVDIRFEPLAQAQFSVSTKELFKLEQLHHIERPQSAFIFHHAFVCSTLLARCLNQIDAFFSLKEPWILRCLAEFKRTQAQKTPPHQWQEMFTCYLNLLARNYRGGKTPVIKVTNVANNLLVDVMKYLPGQKILYLYSDLESFLVSNLKKPRETQIKIPGLTAGFLQDGDFAQRFPQFGDLNNQSFLKVCALLWLVNLYNFQRNTQELDSVQVRTLEMNSFLAGMGASLRHLSDFFGHHPAPMELKRMLDPDITQRNAKQQQVPYDRQSKETEMRQVFTTHRTEITQVIHWIKPLVDELGVLEYCQTLRLGQ